jgi:outer membrane protein OmpA-like peptidoglycan-associated protein
VKARDLSLRLAPVTPSRIQERRPCAEDEWRWEPTLRVYRSPDDDGAKPMLFEPACGWGWAPADAAHAQAARSLAGLLAQEAADCLRRAFDPLELLAAQGRSAHHRDTGWRKLAAGAPRVAAEEFRACLKEAVQGRVIEECARGLEEADGRVKAGAPEAAPRALEYAVAFRPGSAEPTPEGLALLSRLADTLRYYPLDGVRLSAAAPEPLARRRLEAARKALTEAGVKAANIETAVEASAGKADSLRVAITEGR